ncbi:MAG: DJ-1/PfpI family protein [Bacilli bacterium]|nr:DJ-1/PfpI family protein [Bacilli bacterium]
MKALMLLANGFEDTEGLTTRDVLIRGGIEVTTASITDSREVMSSFGVRLLADTTIDNVDTSYDILVLPGGGRGTQNLALSRKTKELILSYDKNEKLLAAICAAPSIYGHMGLLKGKRYTCFAGCNEGVDGIFTANEVEVDGRYITARSMQYSIPFALAIIEKMLGKEAKERVIIGLQGLNAK